MLSRIKSLPYDGVDTFGGSLRRIASPIVNVAEGEAEVVLL